MSFYDDASLVMIPSGYKTSKVYSVKPTDGTGDLTFTRSNDTATRVASNGLIEKVRTNLLTYSNTFSNAAWIQDIFGVGGSFVRTYSQADPFGGTAAAKFDISVGTGGVLLTQNFTATANAEHGLSVWLKGAVGGEKVQIDLRNTASSGVSGGLLTLTTEWVRYKITANNDAGTARGFQFRVTTSIISGSEAFYVYGAQAETGVPTDYIPTTTAAVSVGPVANVPRLDYLNSSCPRLLLEPQRTNLALYSEQFDNAAWAKLSTTVTANTTISPDGYTNADTIAFTASATSRCERGVGGAYESQTHTVSVYAKVASGTATFRLKCTHASVEDYFSSDLTATTQWQRFTFTQAFGSTTGSGINFGIINGTDALAKNIIFYGFQTEVNASYATSYIPTLGAAVTRGADAASKTGISSLIGSTAGTVYFEGVYDSVNEPYVRLIALKGAGTTYQDLFMIQDFQNGNFNLQVTDASVAKVVDITWAHGLTNGQTFKIAVSYANNDVVVYQNGVSKGTDTSYTPITFSDFYLQFTDVLGKTQTKQALLFKTRLTNAQLAELTTL